VVLLDVVLPEIDGIEVCRRLRRSSDAYVIMLTSKDHEVDRVVGLSVGADDYVIKPFFPREVSARISALARRAHAPMVDSGPSARVFADLGIDTEARRVTVAGEEVALTKKEFDLLDAITSRPKIVHTREMLRERIWGESWFGDDHVVDVHIANLRKKIDKDRSKSRIETIRGVGFRLEGGTYGDAGGKDDGVIASVRTADEHVETEQRLESSGRSDALAGLLSGAEAFARLEAALNKPRSPGPYQGLLFCDIDNFKDINDTWGHTVGDAVLATVAARIHECIRVGDTVGRVGGDKMLVLLPGVHNLAEVVNIAEKIRRRADEPVEHSGESIYSTLSIGATTALPGESATAATARADAAVLRAKNSGRNTVIGIDAAQHR
nr:diguanylate cyclase [Actinomycetes bacterium]